MKKFTKKQLMTKIVFTSISAPIIIGGIIGIAYGNHLAFNVYANNLTELFNGGSSSTYNDESRAAGNDLSREIVKEGSVLLKNNGTLPLSKSIKKVNCFGYNSVDWYFSGSGSGQVSANGEVQHNICTALATYGVEYNKDLYNFYRNYRTPTGATNPWTISVTCEEFCVLAEPDLTSAIKTNAESFSTTAIVSLGRKAGETEDIPLAQYKYNRPTDTTKTYLEASDEELALLEYVGSHFENVIVLINSTNTMQLDFLDKINGIDACLIVGNTGNFGAVGICDLLFGDASPSGKLTDTYPYDLKTNITYFHGGYETTGQYQNANPNAFPYNRNYKRGQEKTVFYQDYIEGIYVGYKWFETADHEHYWDSINNTYGTGYDGVVQFPFGHGLSYTTFDWKVDTISKANNSEITNTDEITIAMTISNTGQMKGQDVVEAYVTAPYKDGGIEKSYVSLVGFNKTPLIQPGKDATIDVEVRVSDFESYDCYDKNNNGHKGFELEAGDYQLKLMSDSHTIKQVKMGNSTTPVDGVITYHVSDTIKVINDEVTGHKVENRFTGDTAEGGISIDGSDSNSNIPFISRSNFPALSSVVAPADRAITDNVKAYNKYTTAQASAWDNATGKDFLGRDIPTTKPTFGQNSGQYKLFTSGKATELGFELGANYDSEKWDDVLNSIPLSQAVTLMNSGSFGSAAVDSVGKPSCNDRDGPAQVGSFNAGNNPGTGFPCATVVCQTFSLRLAYQFGINYGKEMSQKGVDGAYAFGCNIHRSPFQGRNYEYMSEDGNLTGFILSKVISGLKNTGKYSYLKHLCIAESEHEREAMYTWLTEQSLREVYLKPFQKAIQDVGCVGIMSSYNRIGGIWTGGSEYLIEGICRYEWGFKGAIVTDYSDHPVYMNGAQSNRAGSNLGLNTAFNKVSGFSNPSDSSSARLLHRVREGTKQILYMLLSCQYQNREYNIHGDPDEQIISYSSIESWVWWKPVLFDIELLVVLGSVLGCYFIFRPWGMKKKIKPTKTNEKGGK